MWTVTGSFDGEVGDLNIRKTKLLKTDSVYTIGRKDTHIIFNNKKISHEQGEFAVEKFTVDDASNPGCIPTLTYINKKKAWFLQRGEDLINAAPGTPTELKDGDSLTIANGISVKVQWVAVCCFSGAAKAKLPVAQESCASLGIHFTVEPTPETTHHLISAYSPTPSTAASLISSCQFVKPEWLQELVRLGSLPKDCDPPSLEDNFVLPSLTKYRPTFSQSLPSAHKVFKVWEPSEERLNLFRKYRFLCVGEKAREIPLDVRKLISRGEGTIEVFDVHSGVAKFQKALSRGRAKEGKTLVLVGDGGLLSTAVGKDVWNELVREAKQSGLCFTPPEVLVKAVLDIDTSFLESDSTPMQIDEPSVSHSTPPDQAAEATPLPEEPEPPKRKRPVRRVTQESSSEPPPKAETPMTITSLLENAPPPRRRPLNRRLPVSGPVPGVEDTSGILDTPPREPSVPPPVTILDYHAPPPVRPKLKRRLDRAGTQEPQTVPAPSTIVEDSLREPPLKKFKALFDASDPANMESGSILEGSNNETFETLVSGNTSSQTQSQTQAKTQRGTRTLRSLSAPREEEEESLAFSLQGKKRNLDDIQEDTAVEDGTAEATTSNPAKKQATESNRVVRGPTATPAANARGTSKPPPQSKPSKPPKPSGAAVGEPDKDVAFLKALASTKRGRKREDEFDREFNKLKISKPDLNDDEPEKEWAVLADFGDDSGIRGNFMTIVELEVFAEKGGKAKAALVPNPEWEGKPNFKKFKKKGAAIPRPKIPLYATNDGGDGMGSSYWKDGSSQQAKSKARRQPSSDATLDEALEMSPPPRKTARSRGGSKQPPSRSGSSAPTTAAGGSKSGRRVKAIQEEEPLFLDLEDESQSLNIGATLDDDDDDGVVTIAPEKTSKAKGKAKTVPAVTTKKTTRRKPVVVRDDSDDDAVFKGF